MSSQLHANGVESEREIAALSGELSNLKNEYIKQIEFSDRLQKNLASAEEDWQTKLDQQLAAMAQRESEHDESLHKQKVALDA